MNNVVLNVLLSGPSNLSAMAAKIKRDLSFTADINTKMSPGSAASLNSFNEATKKTAALTQVANNHLYETGKLIQKQTYDISAFGQQSALAMKRFLAFSTATSVFLGLVYSFKQGVVEANAFEKEMLKVAQTTGKSYSSLGGLANEITRLSTTFGVSSKELSHAALLIASAGYSARDTQKALQALALTDIAPSFENMSNTTEGAIAIMQQFGVSASDLEKKLGSLNAVAAGYAVESRDLVSAVQRTGGAFKAAGGSFEELMALFTAVRSTTRESADSIATGFRTIFTRMQRPSTIKFLQDMGVELDNTKGQFIGAMGAVEKLSQALSSLPTTDPRYMQIMEELGGYRQISKIIPLIQQYGLALRALDTAQAGTTSLQEMAGVALGGLSNHLSRVKEDFLGLFRELTQSTGFKTIADSALNFATALIGVTRAIEPLLPMLTAMMSIKAAVATVGFVGSFAKGLATPLGGVPKRAAGGYIPGSGNTDNTLIAGTPGEFVISKGAAQKIGASRLHSLNRYGFGGPVNVISSMTGNTLLNKAGNVYPQHVLDTVSNDTQLLSLMPKNSRMLNSGTQAIVFKRPDGKVVRYQQRITGGERPALEGLLQAEKTIESNGVIGEVLPNVPSLADSNRRVMQRLREFHTGKHTPENRRASNIVYRALKRVEERFRKQGIYAKDTHEGNVGIDPKTGRFTLIDPGHLYQRSDENGGPMFASGGHVPGTGDSDSVLAKLTPGEFVIKKSAAKKLGPNVLNRLNGYEDGGTVTGNIVPNEKTGRWQAGPGGITVNIKDIPGVKEGYRQKGEMLPNALMAYLRKQGMSFDTITNTWVRTAAATRADSKIQTQSIRSISTSIPKPDPKKPTPDTSKVRTYGYGGIQSQTLKHPDQPNSIFTAGATAPPLSFANKLVNALKAQPMYGEAKLTQSMGRSGSMSNMAMAGYMGAPLVEGIMNRAGATKETSGLVSQGMASSAMMLGMGGMLSNSFIGGPAQMAINRQQVITEQLTASSKVLEDAKDDPKQKRLAQEHHNVLTKAHDINTARINALSRISAGVNSGVMLGALSMGGLSTLGQSYENSAMKDAATGEPQKYKAALKNQNIGQKYQNASTYAGVGAMAGGLIGGFTPLTPVGGAAVGAAAGGALGYALAGSDTTEISKVRLNKLTDDITAGITDVATGLQKGSTLIASSFGDVASQLAKADILLSEAVGDMRPEIVSQLAAQAPNIRAIMSSMAAEASTIKDFMTKFGSSGEKVIATYAKLTGKTIPAVTAQLEKEIKQSQNAHDATEKFSASIKDMANISIFIDNMSGAFTQATASIKETISVMGLGGTSGLSQYRGTPGAVEMLANPEKATNMTGLTTVIRSMMSQMGPKGVDMGEMAIKGAQAIQDLPTILADAASRSGFNDDNLTTNLNGAGQLSGRYGPMIANHIMAGLDKALSGRSGKGGPGQVTSEIKEDARGFADKILKDSSLREMLKGMSEIYGKHIEIENEINVQHQKYVDNAGAIQQKELDARQSWTDKEMAMAQIFETPTRGISAQLNTAQMNQQTLAGNLANDPVGIANRINALQKERAVLDKQFQGPESDKGAISDKRDKVETELNSLKKALEDLASSSLKLRAEQEGLAKATSDRKTKQEYATSFAFGSPETRISMGRTLAGARYAANNNNLDKVPYDLRESVSGFFDKFADVALPMFGKDKDGNMRKGRDVQKDVTASEMRKVGLSEEDVQAMYRSPDENKWIDKIVTTYDRMELAQQSLGVILKENQANLSKDLMGIFTDLKLSLEKGVAETERRDLVVRKETTQNQLNEATGVFSTVDQARGLGIGIQGETQRDVAIQTQQAAASSETVLAMRRRQEMIQELGMVAGNAAGLALPEAGIDMPSTIGKFQSDAGPFGNRFEPVIQKSPEKPSAFDALKNVDINTQTPEQKQGIVAAIVASVVGKSKVSDDTRAMIEESVRANLPKLKDAKTSKEAFGILNDDLSTRQDKLIGKNREDMSALRTSAPEASGAIDAMLQQTPDELVKLNEKLKVLAGAFDHTVTIWKDGKIEERTYALGDAMESATKALATIEETLTNIQKKTDERVNASGVVPAARMSSGGSIFKPRGTDTVPAMLTPGEYIVKASEAKKHKGILENINKGRGAMYAEGGGMALEFTNESLKPDWADPAKPYVFGPQISTEQRLADETEARNANIAKMAQDDEQKSRDMQRSRDTMRLRHINERNEEFGITDSITAPKNDYVIHPDWFKKQESMQRRRSNKYSKGLSEGIGANGQSITRTPSFIKTGQELSGGRVTKQGFGDMMNIGGGVAALGTGNFITGGMMMMSGMLGVRGDRGATLQQRMDEVDVPVTSGNDLGAWDVAKTVLDLGVTAVGGRIIGKALPVVGQGLNSVSRGALARSKNLYRKTVSRGGSVDTLKPISTTYDKTSNANLQNILNNMEKVNTPVIKTPSMPSSGKSFENLDDVLGPLESRGTSFKAKRDLWNSKYGPEALKIKLNQPSPPIIGLKEINRTNQAILRASGVPRKIRKNIKIVDGKAIIDVDNKQKLIQQGIASDEIGHKFSIGGVYHQNKIGAFKNEATGSFEMHPGVLAHEGVHAIADQAGISGLKLSSTTFKVLQANSRQAARLPQQYSKPGESLAELGAQRFKSPELMKEWEQVRGMLGINKPFKGFATGGAVSSKDIIPSLLGDGEFVVSATQTKKNRGILEHMNAGGIVYAATGGGITEDKRKAQAKAELHQRMQEREKEWNKQAIERKSNFSILSSAEPTDIDEKAVWVESRKIARGVSQLRPNPTKEGMGQFKPKDRRHPALIAEQERKKQGYEKERNRLKNNSGGMIQFEAGGINNDPVEEERVRRIDRVARRGILKAGKIPNIRQPNTTDAGRSGNGITQPGNPNWVGANPGATKPTGTTGVSGTSVGMDPKFLESINAFNLGMKTFTTTIDTFSNSINSLKGAKLEISGMQKVDVVINGAEALKELEPLIRKIALDSVNQSVNNFKNKLASGASPASIPDTTDTESTK